MPRFHHALVVAIGVSTPCAAQITDLDQTLDRIETLVQHHRYQEVVETLTPLEGQSENRETRYIIAAELGRAYFHLGQYCEAHERLRLAVSLHPERVETALYLQATAYLIGDRDQALTILEAVLKSGARDLYLAVTLPGESAFLVDDEVRQLIDNHAIPIILDPDTGTVNGVELGMAREEVARILHAPEGPESKRVLTARAGPHPIWSYTFSGADTLDGIVLRNEMLLRYTPYRLLIGDLDWSATPAAITSLLGAPDDTSFDEHNHVTMSWQSASMALTMVFGDPLPPRPVGVRENVAMLKFVQITSVDQPAAVEP